MKKKRIYTPEQLEAGRIRNAEWRKNNPELVKAKSREWNKTRPKRILTPDQKEAKRLKNLEWAKNNPERVKENSKRSSYKRYHSNPEKAKVKNKAYHLANPHKMREYDLKRRFGITPEQYDEMLTNQEGCCAICRLHQTEFKIRLSVDHNHDTGEIRGLLCKDCNTSLGALKEDKTIIMNMIKYLENYENRK